MRLDLRRFAFIDKLAGQWARAPWWGKAVVMAAMLAFAILVPAQLPTYWQSVLFFPVGIYIILALGLNIVVGMAGLLDLGYVAFYAVGAYTTAKLTTTFGWGAWETLPVAIFVAMVAGVLLGAPTLRLRGDYLAIVTLGFGEIVRIVAQNTESLGASRGITGIKHPQAILGTEFKFDPLPYYYLTLAFVVVGLFFLTRLTRSRVGRSWAAIREDEDAAEAMGVPTFNMKLWAFAMGAATGGAGGWLYASKVGFINPDNFPFFFSVIILAAVVLGGMGSVPGVIAGAFAIGFIPEYLRDAAAGESIKKGLNLITGGDVQDITEYRVLLFGFALVVMMIFRPQGLIPSRQRAAELAEAGEGRGLAATPVSTHEAADDLFAPPEASTTTAASGAEGSVTDLPVEVEAAETVLELDKVTMEFGGVVAMNEVSLAVRRGQIFGVIGPNGAGKTTLFNALVGAVPCDGDVRIDGHSAGGWSPARRARAGLGRTFQRLELFGSMTVEENLRFATEAGALSARPWRMLARRRYQDGPRADAMLERLGMEALATTPAADLPPGSARLLELGRALCAQPSVVLLDEPSSGLDVGETEAFGETLRAVVGELGVGIVLVEHDVSLVLRMCERLYVLEFGSCIASGATAEVAASPAVQEAYLGDVAAS